MGGFDVRLHEGFTIREDMPEQLSGGLWVFRGLTVAEQLPTRGAEADILLLRDEGGECRILKLYRYRLEPKAEILERVRQISQAHARHFVVFFDAGFDEATGRWFELQEYMPLGSLKDVPDERKRDPEFVRGLVSELAGAIHCLHENGIVHCDIKPGNVLARSLDPLDLVLTDFGIASFLSIEASRKLTTLKGTPMYRAPEAFSHTAGRPGDWWGLGMIVLELLVGEHPFAGLSASQILHRLTLGNAEIPDTLSEEWKLLLRGLLTKDDSKRWGHGQVARWLAGERDIPVYREAVSRAEDSVHPFRFEGKEYREPRALLRAFCEDGEVWQRAARYLDYLRPWIKANGWTGEPGDPGEPLAALLAVMEDKTPSERAACADALREPGRFVWPRDADTGNLQGALDALVKMRAAPVRFGAWKTLRAEFLLPPALSERLESTETYADALKRLRELRDRDLLIPASFAAHPFLSDGLTPENCESRARLVYWNHTPENLTRLHASVEGLKKLALIPGFRRKNMLSLGTGRLADLATRRISPVGLHYLNGIHELLERRSARTRFTFGKLLAAGMAGGLFVTLPQEIGRLVRYRDLRFLALAPLVCLYVAFTEFLPGNRKSSFNIDADWPNEKAFTAKLCSWVSGTITLLVLLFVPPLGRPLDIPLFTTGFVWGMLLYETYNDWALRRDCIRIATACASPYEEADGARRRMPVIDF